MNRIPFIFLLTFFCSCQTQDKESVNLSVNQLASSSDTLTKVPDFLSCKKCDKGIIETATEHWDKLSDAQVEQFLCSFDKKCKLEDKYKNSGVTYAEIASQMLIVQLDRHLNTCTKFFDTNKDIDFTYILSLLENAAGHDVPWPRIISQLSKKRSLTATEQKIFDTIKKSEADFKKKYNKAN